MNTVNPLLWIFHAHYVLMTGEWASLEIVLVENWWCRYALDLLQNISQFLSAVGDSSLGDFVL